MNHVIGRRGQDVLRRLLPALAWGGWLVAALTGPAYAEPSGGRGERLLAEINPPAGQGVIAPCLEHPSNCRGTTNGSG